jgi:division/cell wall cluster transcriptional repressor MraZ
MVTNNTPPLAPTFAGEFRHKVEGKARITVPAKWRFEDEVEMFMIIRGEQRCISVLTREGVDKIIAELEAQSPEDRTELIDILGASLRQVTLDKGGRISIPEDLLKELNIAGEVMLAGAVKTFTIWNVADFEANKASAALRKAALLRRIGL